MVTAIFLITAAMSTPSAYEIVVAGRHSVVADCLLNSAQTRGWNVELNPIKGGSTVAAEGNDGSSQWSVTLSRFQAFQSVSLASITYGTTGRDAFQREVWPIIEEMWRRQ
ncbi:hypothetical protein N8D56_25570 (plasmid) [Devosia sp. A8/3-2]|nr:hypothetical protein N8D56_25570 [Devosia sp. A8/3-2]